MKKLFLFLTLLFTHIAAVAQIDSELLRKAEQGDAEAQNSIGDCYYFGKGVQQDYNQAVDWYKKAAGQGDATAQNNLGICYANGQGVKQDYKQAVLWYKKDTEQSTDDAQDIIGLRY